MDMRAIAMKRNRVIKKRNPIAKALKFFTPKIIRDKTKYNRKTDGQIWKKYLWK